MFPLAYGIRDYNADSDRQHCLTHHYNLCSISLSRANEEFVDRPLYGSYHNSERGSAFIRNNSSFVKLVKLIVKSSDSVFYR